MTQTSTKNSKSKILSRDLIEHINKEREKSNRSTVARLDSIVKGNKQNYKSSLNPISIIPINTSADSFTMIIRETSQELVPTNTPLSIIRMHIP